MEQEDSQAVIAKLQEDLREKTRMLGEASSLSSFLQKQLDQIVTDESSKELKFANLWKENKTLKAIITKETEESLQIIKSYKELESQYKELLNLLLSSQPKNSNQELIQENINMKKALNAANGQLQNERERMEDYKGKFEKIKEELEILKSSDPEVNDKALLIEEISGLKDDVLKRDRENEILQSEVNDLKASLEMGKFGVKIADILSPTPEDVIQAERDSENGHSEAQELEAQLDAEHLDWRQKTAAGSHKPVVLNISKISDQISTPRERALCLKIAELEAQLSELQEIAGYEVVARDVQLFDDEQQHTDDENENNNDKDNDKNNSRKSWAFVPKNAADKNSKHSRKSNSDSSDIADDEADSSSSVRKDDLDDHNRNNNNNNNNNNSNSNEKRKAKQAEKSLKNVLSAAHPLQNDTDALLKENFRLKNLLDSIEEELQFQKGDLTRFDVTDFDGYEGENGAPVERSETGFPKGWLQKYAEEKFGQDENEPQNYNELNAALGLFENEEEEDEFQEEEDDPFRNAPVVPAGSPLAPAEAQRVPRVRFNRSQFAPSSYAPKSNQLIQQTPQQQQQQPQNLVMNLLSPARARRRVLKVIEPHAKLSTSDVEFFEQISQNILKGNNEEIISKKKNKNGSPNSKIDVQNRGVEIDIFEEEEEEIDNGEKRDKNRGEINDEEVDPDDLANVDASEIISPKGDHQDLQIRALTKEVAKLKEELLKDREERRALVTRLEQSGSALFTPLTSPVKKDVQTRDIQISPENEEEEEQIEQAKEHEDEEEKKILETMQEEGEPEDLEEAKMRIKKLEDQIKKLCEKIGQLRIQNTGLSHSELSGTISALNTNDSLISRDFQLALKQIASLQRKLEERSKPPSNMQQFQDEIGRLKSELQDSSQKALDLQEQLDAFSTSTSQGIVDVVKENKNLKKLVERKDKEIEDATNKGSDILAKYNEQQNTVKSLINELKTVKSHYFESQKRIQEANDQILALKDEADKAIDDAESYRDDLTRLDEVVGQNYILQSDLDITKIRLDAATKLLKTKGGTRAIYALDEYENITSYQREIAAQKELLINLARELDNRCNQNQQQKPKLEHKEDEFEEEEEELKEEHKENEQSMENDNVFLKIVEEEKEKHPKPDQEPKPTEEEVNQRIQECRNKVHSVLLTLKSHLEVTSSLEECGQFFEKASADDGFDFEAQERAVNIGADGLQNDEDEYEEEEEEYIDEDGNKKKKKNKKRVKKIRTNLGKVRKAIDPASASKTKERRGSNSSECFAEDSEKISSMKEDFIKREKELKEGKLTNSASSQLIEELRSTMLRASDIADKYASLHSEFVGTIQELQESNAKNTAATVRCAELESENRELLTKLEDNEEMNKLREDENGFNTLYRQNKESTQKIGDLEQQLEIAAERLRKLEDSEMAAAQDKILALENENKALNRTTITLKNKLSILDTDRLAALQANTILTDKCREFQKKMEKLNAKLLNNSNINNNLSESSQITKTSLAELEKDLNKANQKADEAEEELRAVKAELKAVKIEANKAGELDEKVKEWQKKAKELVQEKNDLLKKVTELEMKVQNAESSTTSIDQQDKLQKGMDFLTKKLNKK